MLAILNQQGESMQILTEEVKHMRLEQRQYLEEAKASRQENAILKKEFQDLIMMNSKSIKVRDGVKKFVDKVKSRRTPLHLGAIMTFDTNRCENNTVEAGEVEQSIDLPWSILEDYDANNKACLLRYSNAAEETLINSTRYDLDNEEVHAYALDLLITHINKVKEDKANCSPVSKMSDLAKLYNSFMKDMGVDHIAHSSSLRDRLLNACLYLQSSGKIGQDCLITFQDDLDEVMRSASRHYDLEAKQYCDVAKILRKDIFDYGSSSWEQGLSDQNSCTPLSLRTFLKMLLRGPGNIYSAREEQSEAEQHGDDQHDDQVINTVSQLICYHTQKKPPRFWPPSTPLSAIRKARSSVPGHENFRRDTEQKAHLSSLQIWTRFDRRCK
ncbi:hypothetical protein FQA39_LY08838 [Lamprigera yunnana]|nr:hypothetical protein FQA39_LY08838 [Lamprigera yunnana]